MDILNPHELRKNAETSLRRGREPKKLIYSYAGISLAISLAVYLANLWLNQQISGIGGLSNLGTRAIFETVRQVLPMLSSVLSMCLNLGFLAGMMRISRGQYADQTDLKTGFRKIWPLFRLSILEALIYFAVAFLAMQLSGLLFMLTPWAEPLMAVLVPIYESGTIALDDALLMDAIDLIIPLLIFTGVVILVMLLPIMYRLRMSYFCLLDDPNGRALAAIRESNRMMRRRFIQMIKIDLSLWLYYAALVLMTLVLYADLILAMLGIPAPMDATVFALVLYVASAGVQFVTHVYLRPTAEIMYLKVYDALREKPQDSGVVLGNIFDM